MILYKQLEKSRYDFKKACSHFESSIDFLQASSFSVMIYSNQKRKNIESNQNK